MQNAYPRKIQDIIEQIRTDITCQPSFNTPTEYSYEITARGNISQLVDGRITPNEFLKKTITSLG